MRRIWIPALVLSLVVAAGLIAIAYGQRGARTARQHDSEGPAASEPNVPASVSAAAPDTDRPDREHAPSDPFGGSWAGQYAGAAADASGAEAAPLGARGHDPLDAETDWGHDQGDAASVLPEQAVAAAAPPRGAAAQDRSAPTPRKPRSAVQPASADQPYDDSQPQADAEAPALAPQSPAPYDADEPADQAIETPYGAGPDGFEGSPAPGRAGRAPVPLGEHGAADTHRPLAAAPPPGPSFDEGAAEPGPRELEGVQAPSVSLEKVAPAEVQVGKPTEFVVRLRNNGVVAVRNVEVRDEVPKGTRLVGTSPAASRGPQGELLWQFETLAPGEEKKLKVQLLPLVEGELGSVATVVFEGRASVRTRATQPALALEVSGPNQVMIGEPLTLSIKVSNTGSGAATGVVLEETIPEQFSHPAGKELELEIGKLRPGESKTVELTMSAVRAGSVRNKLAVLAEGDLTAAREIDLEVLAPELRVELSGPTRRFLETRATYTVSVSNPGTATAKNVELVTYLPKGLRFVQANNAGQYDAVKHSVHWSLVELPAAEKGDVTLVAEPVEQGEHKLKVSGTAQQGLADEVESTVVVEGLAAILFQVADLEDPIEVGGETTYEIRVMNQGSKAATNVVLVAHLAPEMTLMNATGPARHAAKGQRVEFEPLKALAPKAETTYKVRVRADAPGDLRLGVQVLTDETKTPITKEESTRAYAAE